MPTAKKSRLHKNFLFSIAQIPHAIQASLAHMPALTSVLLTNVLPGILTFKTDEIFIRPVPNSNGSRLFGSTLNFLRCKTS
jgi:hypothetical protein